MKRRHVPGTRSNATITHILLALTAIVLPQASAERPASPWATTMILEEGAETPSVVHARLDARVDPRIELLSIIFRLAGNPEYNEASAVSPYSAKVDAYFKPYADHAVVKTARKLRSKRGISYDAVTTMAVHITDTIQLKERAPFDDPESRLRARWRVPDARKFLRQARAFVEESNFNVFLAAERYLFDEAGKRMTAVLSRRDYVGWLERYFGPDPNIRVSVIVSMLDGPHARGVSVLHPDGVLDVFAVMGMSRFDDAGLPVVRDAMASTLIHEFSHSYVNPIVDKHADQLRPAAERIFVHAEQAMNDQAYGNWRTMMCESLVRACEVRYALETDGPDAANRRAQYNVRRGFLWTGELAELLGDYESDRSKYPTLDPFMPRVVTFFKLYADRYDEYVQQMPQVASMTPANGETNVDPSLRQITITFDRAMANGSWGLFGNPDDMPEIAGKLSYDSTFKILTVPVRLMPRKTYRFSLNSMRQKPFRSQGGVPLQPVRVTFQTASK